MSLAGPRALHGTSTARVRLPMVWASSIAGIVAFSNAAATAPVAAPPPCFASLSASSRLIDRTLEIRSPDETRVALPRNLSPGSLVLVLEAGADVRASLVSAHGKPIVGADNPTPRFGAQRLLIGAVPPDALVIRSKEHEGHAGSVRVLLVESGSDVNDSCMEVARVLATADATYARGYQIARTRGPREATQARQSYSAAAELYIELSAQAAAKSSALLRADLELTLSNLYYHDLQEWVASEDWATKAAASFRAARHDYGWARAQAMVAAARMEVATKASAPVRRADVPSDSRSLLDNARDLLAQLAAFHAARQEHYDATLQVNNIGLAYYYEARFEKAIEWFAKARASFERQGEAPRLALAIQNTALCEWGLGRLRASLPQFDRALQIMRPEPYPDLYLLTLNNSGLAHYAAGRFDESLRLHNQALDFALGMQNERYRARALYGIGVTYYAIGDRALATRFLEEAVRIWTPDLDARGRVAALRALAVIDHENGSYASALDRNSEALRLATAPSARAWILLRLAGDHAASGEAGTAMRILEPLANYAPNGDVLIQAAARLARARLLRASGAYAQAQSELLAALETFRTQQALAEQFEAGEELARLHIALGRPEAALRTIDEALALTDELRTQTANPEYRASIVQSIRPALDLRIDLLRSRYERLVAAGEHLRARELAIESLRTADESRSRAFEEVLLQRPGADSDPRIAGLVAQRETILRDLADRRFYLSTRADRAGTADARAALLRDEIARLRLQLGVVDTRLAGLATADDDATGARPATAPWIERALRAPPDRALVEYWMGASNAYVWSIVAGKVSWLKLADSAAIERAARQLHDGMMDYTAVPSAQRLAASETLSRLIIAPLRAELHGAQDMLVVPDGVLHFVPFGALRDPRADDPWLIERFTIAFTPALRLVFANAAAGSPRRAGATMLMVADPIYRADDPRLPGSPQVRRRETLRGGAVRMRNGVSIDTLARLESTAREAKQIGSFFGGGRFDLLEGPDATRANVLAKDLHAYRFIHLAAHGIVDAEIPQLSAIILGAYGRDGGVADQQLWAADLLAQNLDADVVVLSACDTALGRNVAGEGPLGLRYATLARGARSVVASLWPVADVIGADLMTEMYRAMMESGSSVDEALGHAMRAMLKRSPSLDPALWAPFTVHVAGQTRE